MSFCTNLDTLMKEKHITQIELSKRTNINNATISRYKNGKITPSIDAVNKIANALDVPVSRLFVNDIVDDDLIVIQRAREKMSPSDKKKMMDILKVAFDYAFK